MILGKPPRQLEPLAVLYLCFVGAALLTAAFTDPLGLGVLWSASAVVGGIAVIFLPWAPGARTRGFAVGILTVVIASRVVRLVSLSTWIGVFVWSTLLAGVILLVSRDQDETFKKKIPPE